MTGPHHDDRAADGDGTGDEQDFGAFLRGEGTLAQALAALPQPAPAAELDAAIQARIATLLVAERGPAGTPAAPQLTQVTQVAEPGGAPRWQERWQERWRMPLALAAGAAAISIALPLWQTDQASQHAANMAPLAQPAPPPPPEAKAAAKQPLAPYRKPATARQPSAPVGAIDDQPAGILASQPATKILPLERPPLPTTMQLPMMPLQPPAPAPAPPVQGNLLAPAAPAPAMVGNRAPGANAQRRADIATDSIVAEDVGAFPPDRLSLDATAAAKAALGHIEALLGKGQRDLARAEWLKFRAAYPAYPVPDTLAEQLTPKDELQP